ncbi:MAG: hypothetical protein SOV55_05345 [Candidatus Borkfalkiaceae bacterium]|nr:hypothetical protein [Christensenellaceae bacterium]
MKKKNLAILLIIPFLFSVLTMVTINATYNYVDVDIAGISWNYGAPEAFKLSDTEYKLEATGVNQKNYTIAAGNELVWKIESSEEDSSVDSSGKAETSTETSAEGEGEDKGAVAEIIGRADGYYLKTLRTGAVTLVCSNAKGNISRKLEAIIYDNGVILAKTAINPSGNNYDKNVYYGEFDMTNGGEKVSAEFVLNVVTEPKELKDAVKITSSDNIEYDEKKETVKIKTSGDAYITFSAEEDDISPYTVSFKVVKDGVNVYTYNDLLNCTNRSASGEIIVLRKSFQSSSFMNTALGKENNVELFGNRTNNGKFSFKDEIYSFKTKYNHEYIDKWNEFAKTDGKYSEITDMIKVGLRVRKDLYGNGYTINLHNLTYPYETVTTSDGQEVPSLTSDNLFRGPLPFYTLGDPNELPLITAYGQDNVGVYIDGDGVTVNDVIIKNCDDVNSLKKLETTGTVVDVDGDNVTIKNSTLSNGKNVLRSFSSENFTADNCLLMHSQNFLFVTGSNEYKKANESEVKTFADGNGTETNETVAAYLKKGGAGDAVLKEYLGNIPKEKEENYRNALKLIQKGLADESVKGEYKGSTVLNNCQFYDSGISSIVFESLFDGPFLYSKAPTDLSDLFAQLFPALPENISGTSYPVKVTLAGDTSFYDYKNIETMDISGLINENISTILKELAGDGSLGGIIGDVDVSKYDINIDLIFPLKNYVRSAAKKRNVSYVSGEKEVTNIPVAYYGGGMNYSTIEYARDYKNRDAFTNEAEVDIMDTYLKMSAAEGARTYYNMMLKTVTVVTGYEPFRFIFTDNYSLGMTPSTEKMTAYAKGA